MKSKGISQKHQEHLSQSENCWLNRESVFNPRPRSKCSSTRVVTYASELSDT